MQIYLIKFLSGENDEELSFGFFFDYQKALDFIALKNTQVKDFGRKFHIFSEKLQHFTQNNHPGYRFYQEIKTHKLAGKDLALALHSYFENKMFFQHEYFKNHFSEDEIFFIENNIIDFHNEVWFISTVNEIQQS